MSSQAFAWVAPLACGTVPFVVLALVVWDTRSELARVRRRLRTLEATARVPAPPEVAAPPVAAPELAAPPVSAPEVAAPPVAAPAPPEAVPPGLGPPQAAPEARSPAARPPDRAPVPPLPALALPSPERLVAWVAASLAGLAFLLGGLLALVAVAERGWLVPSLRVGAGLAVGTAAWVGGAAASRLGWRATGSALAGAGIGTLYGAAYAGSGLYHLLPAWLTGAVMVGVTGLGTARAWRHGDRFVAWLSLLGGLLTPVLLSTGENRPWHLFAYLVLLLAGTLAAAARRGWFEVVALAGLGVGALYVGWTAQWRVVDQVPAGLAGALLLSAPFLAVGRSKDPGVAVVGGLAATAWPFLALPWLLPVTEVFVDPRSGLTTTRDPVVGPWAPTLAAIALVSLPFLAARSRPVSALLAVPAAWVVPVATVGGLIAADAPDGWIGLAAVGALLASTLFSAGDGDGALAVALTLPSAALAAAVGANALDAPGPLLTAAAVWVAAVGLGGTLRSGVADLLALAALAALSLGAVPLAGDAVRSAAAGLALGWAVVGLWPVRGARPRLPVLAWLAAAGAPIAVFPGLYRA